MDAKFTRPQSFRLSCLGGNDAIYHKLQPKAKTIPELKDVLQRIWIDLLQKSIAKSVKYICKQLEACMSANEGHFEHNI